MIYREVNSKVDFPTIEEEVLKFWEENKIFEKTCDKSKYTKEFVFYDGPPFATGLPHYGHLLACTIKDIVPRYWSMKGFYVERRFGWDCHGLPVEYEMEKELNLSGKKDILSYGVAKFNENCRSIVLRYTKQWEKTVKRLGRWVDFVNDYKTMDPYYMESIWWVFKKLWEKGLIYEGFKVMPYCPRCSTPLSNFETNQGYKEIDDVAITVKFRMQEDPNSYFLAWTTTPWTLPSNTALAVNPEIIYVKVKDLNDGNIYILAKSRITSYWREDKEYKILEEIKGERLTGKRYEPLFPFFKERYPDIYKVVEAEFVSTEEGTGIVHIAPAFGEDDYNVGKKENLPLINPLDEEGKFSSQIKPLEGLFVKDADRKIIELLKKSKSIVKHETIRHSYPFCWRCDSPLIYMAISTWFVKVESIKDKLLDCNSQIHWVPEHIKYGRFGKWLENARDWAISRNRYWGCPIPVWRCKCGNIRVIGSIKELESLSGEKITDIHKHYVDHIIIPCDRCNDKCVRVPEVLDCWFESGAMPYAQNHYPFENTTKFEKNFPADFIAEGLDQTRGWFYTLTVLAAALFGKPAFKNVIVNGLILAEDGKKMSKRLKNYPDPEYILSTYGADALRLYMINSPVVKAEDLKFSEKGIENILKSVLLPLWNAYSFFVTYANIDKWKPSNIKNFSPSDVLDIWILSRLQTLKRKVIENMEKYYLYKVVPILVEFIDELTNWYIRRSRRRFWKEGPGKDKEDAYHTLYIVLVEFVKVLAPFLPFISEHIYQNLVKSISDDSPESVHLCKFPEPEDNFINLEIENQMAYVMKVVELGRSLRVKNNLKIRQPLQSITIITSDKEIISALERNSEIIKKELNIKEVLFSEDELSLVKITAKPNFKVLGPRYGKDIKKLIPVIQNLKDREILDIEKGKEFRIKVEELGEIILSREDIVVYRHEKEGVVIATEGKITVALDTVLTEELVLEGYAREVVNRVQNTRKEFNLRVEDRIYLYLDGDSELLKAVRSYKEYIKHETLAVSIIEEIPPEVSHKEWSIEDKILRIGIKVAY